MALSRIWSAFILIAILVASFKYMFSDDYKAIYNYMVVGKSGDTIVVAVKPLTEVGEELQRELKEYKNIQRDKINYQYDE